MKNAERIREAAVLGDDRRPQERAIGTHVFVAEPELQHEEASHFHAAKQFWRRPVEYQPKQGGHFHAARTQGQ